MKPHLHKSKSTTRALERYLGDQMRAHLPHAIAELVMFGLKQGWAALLLYVSFATVTLVYREVLLAEPLGRDDRTLANRTGTP